MPLLLGQFSSKSTQSDPFKRAKLAKSLRSSCSWILNLDALSWCGRERPEQNSNLACTWSRTCLKPLISGSRMFSWCCNVAVRLALRLTTTGDRQEVQAGVDRREMQKCRSAIEMPLSKMTCRPGWKSKAVPWKRCKWRWGRVLPSSLFICFFFLKIFGGNLSICRIFVRSVADVEIPHYVQTCWGHCGRKRSEKSNLAHWVVSHMRDTALGLALRTTRIDHLGAETRLHIQVDALMVPLCHSMFR